MQLPLALLSYCLRQQQESLSRQQQENLSRQQQAPGGAGRAVVDEDGVLPAPAVPAREPWWLPRPRNVSGLLQSAADDMDTTSSRGGSSVGGGGDRAGAAGASGVEAGSGRVCDGAYGGACVTGEAGGVGEPVLVLPVMSRALDVQFARLLREVLHSSLAAGTAGSSSSCKNNSSSRGGE